MAKKRHIVKVPGTVTIRKGEIVLYGVEAGNMRKKISDLGLSPGDKVYLKFKDYTGKRRIKSYRVGGYLPACDDYGYDNSGCCEEFWFENRQRSEGLTIRDLLDGHTLEGQP